MNTKSIQYVKSQNANRFLTALRGRVNNYFTERHLTKKATPFVVFKVVILLSAFLIFYLLMISNKYNGITTLLFAILCGLSSVLIIFNVAHDASHNTLFKSKRLNKMLSYSFNLVGSNRYMWNITHDKIHHTYPNVMDIDADLNQSKPLFRICPAMQWRPIHRYQHIYAPFVYLFYIFFLIWIKDFQDFKIIPKKDSPLLDMKHSKKEIGILYFSKMLYLLYVIVLPILILSYVWWQILLGYLLVTACMSVLLCSVMLPLHVHEYATFGVVSKSSKIHKSWVVHTLENTTDFLAESKVANFFFGGLNAHVIHHLCPGICHIHSDKLSSILRKTITDYNMEYRNLSMWKGIRSHFKLLKKLGRS